MPKAKKKSENKKVYDYYAYSKGRKVGDFLIGFFAAAILSVFIPSMAWILLLVLITVFIIIKRKWMAFGILGFFAVILLIVLLFWGACAVGLLGSFP